MDESSRLLLAEAFPNMPEALAEEWIAPFVKKLGPPCNSHGWMDFLLGYPIEFWRRVSWGLDSINLFELAGSQLTSESNMRMTEMEKGYFGGVRNAYAVAIPDGKTTTERALKHLRAHRVFISPPVLLDAPDGGYEIMDGNHRMLAYIQAMRAHPPAADQIQEVWIGRKRIPLGNCLGNS